MEGDEGLRRAMSYLERAVEMVFGEIEGLDVDRETRARRMHLLTQLISALVKLREAMGGGIEEDAALVELINKAPLVVVKGVERETGMRFRRGEEEG